MRYHDCVILPGLGALIASGKPAHYDEISGIFHPPLRQVCFNGAVSNDDGLLVDSIRRRGNISFEEARSLMQRQLHTIRITLERDSEVTLGKVGTLRRDSEGNVSFHPFRTSEQMMEEMGYFPLDMIQNGNEGEKPSRESALVATRTTATQSQSDAECKESVLTADVAEYNIEEEEEPTSCSNAASTEGIRKRNGYYIIAINKTLAHVAVAIMAVLALTLPFLIPHTDTGERRVEASVVPVNTLAENKSEDTLPNVADYKGPKSENDAEQGECHLVVGTFGSKEEAARFMEMHTESPWGLRAIENKGKTMVVAASSVDQEALLSLSTDKGFKKEYSASWVWHR
ncbi:MAG: hypothetical protein NC328_04270 [Muribaculum sp.]|nr:hypothetical protein [Muribaculum sp.]